MFPEIIPAESDAVYSTQAQTISTFNFMAIGPSSQAKKDLGLT